MVFYFAFILIWGFAVPPKYLESNSYYRPGSPGFMFSRLKEVKTVKDVDILFLGSSHAYRGFDTRFFTKKGYKSFNLGSLSQSPLQTKVLLDRYLAQLDPKTIIYEVYPFTFASDGVESSLDIIANDRNDKYSIKMSLEINNPKVYNTLAYALVRDFFNLNKDYKEPSHKGQDRYISGGFVEKDLTFYKKEKHPVQKWNFNSEQFAALEDIDSILEAKNIKVFYVYAPITPSLYNSYSNNAEFDSIIQNFGIYYNFNEILTLDDSLNFYDTHHLNQNGVQLFNKSLLDIINLKL